MPHQPGEHLGPFEITAFIGAGGMGEVYRARDTRLGRTVAIKVLSPDLAQKPDLHERFEREAQTISTLNHPAICTLYDVGRDGNVDYLVMEFLEGETLADRLARGPLSLKDALPIAAQIAEGLVAAHRQGIVHRDLKPSNVMLIKADTGRSAVQAKLLDFGLAKLRGGSHESTPVVVSAARTDVGNLTAVGAVLGTLQYMSPEQLEGKEADTRSDIFALGAVVYEMATGRKAFEGKSQVSLMAAILEQDPPPVSTLQPVSPRSLDHLIGGCLAKDPADRWQSAADVVKQLKWIAEESDAPPAIAPAARAVSRKERVAWMAGLAVLVVAVAALAIRVFVGTRTAPHAQIRFEMPPPDGSVFPGANGTPRVAVSPDGRYIAFTVNHRDGKADQLWIRRLDSLQPTPLVIVTDIVNESVQQPFWSPDSRFVGFFVDGKLKKVDVMGGVVQTLSNVPGNNYGGTWSADGTILIGASGTRGIQRVPAGGGVPAQVTRLESKETAHLWPRFLPDGRHFLYHAHGTDGRAIYVGSLDEPTRVRLFNSLYMADFAPPDRLLFVREGALLAQRLDTRTLRLQGEPAAVIEGVQASPVNGRAAFSVSSNGVLVYRAGSGEISGDSQLAWLDRSGKEIATLGPPAAIRGLELSPTGERAALHTEDANDTGDIWIADLQRAGSLSRLTFDPARHNHSPVWSPDGRRIIFGKSSVDSWAIYDKDSNNLGSERLLYESKTRVFPSSVSPDGKTLVIAQINPDTGIDLMIMPLAAGSTPSVFIKAPGTQAFGQVSPDGRWIAYNSNESGSPEIFVESFPTPGTKYLVSTKGGGQPRWRRDGRELLYRETMNGGPIVFMAVNVEPMGSGLRFGIPARLLGSTVSSVAHITPAFTYAVAADGQRILVARTQGEGASFLEKPLTVVVNWDATLTR